MTDIPSDIFFNKQGEPITASEYAALRGDDNYFRIGDTRVGNIWVSTVWLGCDHSFSNHAKGRVLQFETMAFRMKNDRDGYEVPGESLEGEGDQYFDRYWTEEDAIKGHKVIVERVKNMRRSSIKRRFIKRRLWHGR